MQASSLAGANILIVEDEALLRKQLASHLEKLGADVSVAGTLAAARNFAAQLGFDFALLDVNLPDGRGTDLLREKALAESVGVVVMTAESGVAGAVEAMKLGALDYLVKPFDPAELSVVIARVRKSRQAARLGAHRRETESRVEDGFFFGSALAGVEGRLQKILAADCRMQGPLPPVLIHGETGTGKTTVARWLHRHGPRAEQELVEVNCSALPESLAESELFGHERGAFTDARTARMGLFEAAHGGTLFLDELPSLSSALQAKVLTAIEDHKIRRLGGNKSIEVDVRIIAATNRDLKQLITENRFREDLYHRLDLYRISIPPLRERGDDILKLAEMLSQATALRHRLSLRPLSAIGRQRLLAYPWPGNVRELSHELERAIVFDESETLNFDHLFPTGTTVPPTATGSGDWFNEAYLYPPQGFKLEEAISRLVRHALKQTGENVSGAARLLGVTRDYIRYRLSGQNPPKEGGE